MSSELSIQGKSVQNIFQLYVDNALIVNRRYQRKLVWSVSEKEKFIDSLLSGYPIPMILTSRINDSTKIQYEILDGLQRLNAITSFIEGEFSVRGQFFDLSSTATTIELLKSGTLKQSEPKLSTADCSRILNYQVPFSITPFNNPEEIDETFRRINTGGRRLSKHDVRQAGSLGEIPRAINKCSIYVRRDSSHTEKVLLNAMKTISISSSKLNYGIRLEDIFWSKHNIITPENIRSSRDEELVAHLISFMLDKSSAQTTSSYLDRIYEAASEENQNLTRALNAIGEDNLLKQFAFIFDELSKILDYAETDFRQHIFQGQATKTTYAFQIIYLALFSLLIEGNRKINNYKDICETIKGSYHKHMRLLEADRKWSNEERLSLVDSLSGVLSKHTSPSNTVDGALGHWVKNLENILNESRTEQTFYDFKSGLIQTSPPENKINSKTISRAIKTLTAMTNTTNGECKIILGVAESKDGAENHKAAYSSDYLLYSNFFIVGVNDEACAHYGTIESYIRSITHIIEKEPITEDFKSHIKSKIVSFSYKDKEIVILNASRLKEPQPYDGKFYKRTVSNNEEIPAVSIYQFMQEFKSA